jgi:hypothetical protein
MFHPIPGIYGLLTGLAVLISMWTVTYLTREVGPFNLDPGGKPGAFEPFLAKYVRVGEFVVGLAAGSIVLLIGSSALHSPAGSLPSYYASPLFLLGCCVLYGIAFMVWLIFHYEDHQHGAKHSRKAYALSLTLGFSSLACFVIGYGWLIFMVTR